MVYKVFVARKSRTNLDATAARGLIKDQRVTRRVADGSPALGVPAEASSAVVTQRQKKSRHACPPSLKINKKKKKKR